MKYAAACSGLSLATAGMMFSLRFRISRKSADCNSRASAASIVEDELVPHAQPALLRLAEVVGVAHARDATIEVDGDDTVVGIALDGQVGRVDDGQLGLEAVRVVDVEVELLLHPGDVRVRLLDV